MNRKPLTVYKASAGSGKTFTLATEYIRLIVENPQSYRNILAVTFTNKATEEMKMRILSQLYGIWKQLPESDNYLRRIAEQTGYEPKVICERAGIGLTNLLNNYNYFRVETIDTFFQSVLRNMARELDLTNNLRIGLNDNQVEEMAVDQVAGAAGRMPGGMQHADVQPGFGQLLPFVEQIGGLRCGDRPAGQQPGDVQVRIGEHRRVQLMDHQAGAFFHQGAGCGNVVKMTVGQQDGGNLSAIRRLPDPSCLIAGIDDNAVVPVFLRKNVAAGGYHTHGQFPDVHIVRIPFHCRGGWSRDRR